MRISRLLLVAAVALVPPAAFAKSQTIEAAKSVMIARTICGDPSLFTDYQIGLLTLATAAELGVGVDEASMILVAGAATDAKIIVAMGNTKTFCAGMRKLAGPST